MFTRTVIPSGYTVAAVASPTNLNADLQLALATIASELHVDLDEVPTDTHDRILAMLRALSAAHYNAGVRDTMVRFGNNASARANQQIASSTDVTPIVGPHGRALRASRLPTPMKPPPKNRGQNDDEGKR